MKPSVSVCIPVWNSEQYLDECLESVFAQDFADFEVVVVNDSSPGSDSSGRTCRQICSAASVFTNIFLYIDEQTQNDAPPLTDEQLYAIGRTAENYVKSNISQIKTLALPELIPEAMQMLKEAWGDELVERVEMEM